MRLKAPRQDLASAVRAVETMTASTTAAPLSWLFAGGASSKVFPAAASCVMSLAGFQSRIGVFVGRELLHAPDDLTQSDAAGVEHRAATLHGKTVTRQVHHVDVGGALRDALLAGCARLR